MENLTREMTKTNETWPYLDVDNAPIQEPAPAIFQESNREFWGIARRFLIYLLRELDKAYGWKTF
jgi:hypothetical protein